MHLLPNKKRGNHKKHTNWCHCLSRQKTFVHVDKWLKFPKTNKIKRPDCVNNLCNKDNGILVYSNKNELLSYDNAFIQARENEGTTLVIHFLPTTDCQLSCFYCFENGINRKISMSNKELNESVKWVSEYLSINKDVSKIKLVLFGGEPLLRKDIIYSAIPLFDGITKQNQKEFSVEIITNGELLDDKFSSFISRYGWERVQITLDGNKETHDERRFGKEKRPTFDKIIKNICMLIECKYMEKIDIRINFDLSIVDSVIALIKFLASTGYQKNISLSFGVLENPTTNKYCSQQCSQLPNDEIIGEKCLLFWKTAKENDFSIPEEIMAGPLCIATTKHSVVIQPDGCLQKCFCSVGKKEYNFSSISILPIKYAQDNRFEMFNKRTVDCRKNKCAYLPICNGGCVWDAVSLYGDSGFKKPACRKIFLSKINLGLLNLNYND